MLRITSGSAALLGILWGAALRSHCLWYLHNYTWHHTPLCAIQPAQGQATPMLFFPTLADSLIFLSSSVVHWVVSHRVVFSVQSCCFTDRAQQAPDSRLQLSSKHTAAAPLGQPIPLLLYKLSPAVRRSHWLARRAFPFQATHSSSPLHFPALSL